MVTIKPFRGLRPPKALVKQLSCLPYDVMDRQEAIQMAKNNPVSLLHISRSEIDLPITTDEYTTEVYHKARENFMLFQDNGWLVQDEEPYYYIYAQTMHNRKQYGIVGAASIDDYLNGQIKKHELTRSEKEKDRIEHVKINSANIEPVFLTYRANTEIDQIVHTIVSENIPDYNFTSDDEIIHQFWVSRNTTTNNKIESIFKEKVTETYVADGHHRTAAAAIVGKEKRDKNQHHNGNEAYNYFLAVHFPDNQLKIMAYNRVVKDLNNLSQEEFLTALSQNFTIEETSDEIIQPHHPHEFSMYLNYKWYSLTAHKNTYNSNNPIESLDVTILSKYVLDKILDIKDLRKDKRIDFVGGIRGLNALANKVDNEGMAVAFALYPVSMEELLNIADSKCIMPPKTTWFEPKLRSGLIIHKL
jgi:uncharacterized protein (DUF1015 family)